MKIKCLLLFTAIKKKKNFICAYSKIRVIRVVSFNAMLYVQSINNDDTLAIYNSQICISFVLKTLHIS